MQAPERTHEERTDEMLGLIFQNLMEKYFRRAGALGFTKDGQTPEEFYGFKPADCLECHHYRIGLGDGFWFRLKDGRVFCGWTGLPSPPGLEDYDEATLN